MFYVMVLLAITHKHDCLMGQHTLYRNPEKAVSMGATETLPLFQELLYVQLCKVMCLLTHSGCQVDLLQNMGLQGGGLTGDMF